MIELIVKEHLSRLMGVLVLLEHTTKDEPKKFVLIEKVGGNEKYGLKTSSFAIQTYGESLYEAAKLGKVLVEKVESLIEHSSIVSVLVNSGPYNFPDLETKKHRYQMYVEIKHY